VLNRNSSMAHRSKCEQCHVDSQGTRLNTDSFSFVLQQSFDWMNESCLNNLNDVYQQYCKDAQPLEKHMRDVFVSGTVDDVIQNFQVSCNTMHLVTC